MNRLHDVRWIDLPSHQDSRGVLTSIESDMDIPFAIQRIFYMHHIVADRGGHAHRDTDQVIIASSGSFKVDLADGAAIETYQMNDATKGLYIPRMIFTTLYGFTRDAVCLVLASTHYDMSKSIRNWHEYRTAIAGRPGTQQPAHQGASKCGASECGASECGASKRGAPGWAASAMQHPTGTNH